MENEAKKTTFLQSKKWLRFQEETGRKTNCISSPQNFLQEGENEFGVGIIEHELPIVGKYFYVPRGPQIVAGDKGQMAGEMQKLIELAEKRNAGWIRIEPENEESLELIGKSISHKILKAPHDMQPRENFVIDISKNEEELLAGMKPKTRYNIGIAKKKGVRIEGARDKEQGTSRRHIEEFLRLTKEMAVRQGIKTHPEEYYRKMIGSLPEDMLKLYVAKYDGKVIAANLVIFYWDTATYLHGASSNENRNVMAPYLLQWQAILDAREKGCRFYDFGGVKISGKSQTTSDKKNDWAGITKFKLGFSVETAPTVFPGSYDVIIAKRKYSAYRMMQKIKSLIFDFLK